MPSVQTILLKHPVLLDHILLWQCTQIGLDFIKIVESQYNTKTYKRGRTGRDGWQRNIINIPGDRNLIKIDGGFLTSTEKVIFYKSRGRKFWILRGKNAFPSLGRLTKTIWWKVTSWELAMEPVMTSWSINLQKADTTADHGMSPGQ